MTDFHCHLLPGIDDGAQTAEEGLKIAQQLSEQGIGRVTATPHYVHHRDKVEDFLSRREQALYLLRETAERMGQPLFPIVMGAEVRLEKDLSRVEGLDRLRMGDSSYILLELPFTPFKEWMEEEIDNISFRYSLTPILAHLDRYEWYSREERQRLLDRPDTVIQFNCSAFEDRRNAKTILRLIQEGRRVVLGSDAHNLKERPPQFDGPLKFLRSKLHGQFARYEQECDRLLAAN
ncbi:MAG: capsular polysaccharide biosynthesis protein [Clostridiales bacterium]|nr:capsular polysaccharide biosynthesis protein [Clostridiales bacterium]